MKKYILLIIISLCLQMGIKAQTSSPANQSVVDAKSAIAATYADTSLAFTTRFHRLDSLVPLAYPNDSSEGGVFNALNRFERFFNHRTPMGIETGEIAKHYLGALRDAANRKENGCAPDEFSGNWENVGPKNFVQSYQNQGWVTDVWVDPLDASFIYLASEGGGLWRTTNGGGAWENISDNCASIGTIGINAMTVNPFDKNDIYISTNLFKHFNNNAGAGYNYGLGLYHTDDGGTTWTQEIMGLPNADFFSAYDIAYCPYLVNGQPYVVLTRYGGDGSDEVYTKYANNSWVNITPNGLTPAFKPGLFTNTQNVKVRWLNDIEFSADFPGKFFICSEVHSPDVCSGLWRFTFNTNNGNSLAIDEVINSKFNGNSVISSLTVEDPNIPGTYLTTTHNDVVMGRYKMEFAGNGKAYIASTILSDNTNAGYYSTEICVTEWDITTNPATYIGLIKSGVKPEFGGNASFAYNPNNPNIMYLGDATAYMIYKHNNVWKHKGLENYGGVNWTNPDYSIHADIRQILIYESDGSATPNGYNDIVYWCTDGGLSKTTMHDITQITSHNNLGISGSEKITIRQATNLNGNGLYIGDLYDVDVYKGNYLATASYHNGYQIYDRENNAWKGNIDGDGMTSKFDKRENVQTFGLFNLLYKHGSLSEINYNSSYPAVFPTLSSSIGVPESNGFRYSPIEQSDDRLYIGVKNVWRSGPNNYAFPQNGNQLTQPLGLLSAVSATEACVAYTQTESDPNRKYYARFERNGNPWAVAKGEYNTQNSNFDWFDITPPTVISDKLPVSDLIVDPKNEDRVFLALTKIVSTDGYNRVLVSENGGTSWSNMSTGLSRLPVNCLVYQKGSDDLIYAGCDDGVYYWNKPTQCWVQMDGNMPASMVTRLTIDYCRGKLMAATYGRGLWESNLINLEPGDIKLPPVSHVIDVNTIWSTDKHIEGSILVKAGYSLTIQGTANTTDYTSSTTVHMPKYGAIYVEQGATLLLDGGKITNDCGEFWYGIRAYGNGYAGQVYNPNGGNPIYNSHGFVRIMNNGIISNAEEAFSNSGGNVSWNTGGVIGASEAIFLNNRRSAQFLKYGATFYVNDDSYFIDCKFILNNDHRQAFGNHITMWGVNGIRIEGCEFINSTSLNQGHGRAIATLDATYTINNSLANNSSVFNGFYKGIESASYSWGNPNMGISIKDATFDNNEISIQLNDMLYPSIVSNDIKIGAKQTPYPSGNSWSYFSLGSLLRNVSHFVYCNNVHTKPYPTPVPGVFQYTAGLELHNSGPDDQQIEKNSYSDLLIGTDIDYTCGSLTKKTGVNLRWNRNQNNIEYDFIFQADGVIRPIQSASLLIPDVGTGNTFSTNATHWHHTPDPGANGPVDYYYDNVPNQVPINYFNVNPLLANTAVGESPKCSKFSVIEDARSNDLGDGEVLVLKNSYYGHETAYLNYKNLYGQLIDDGSTADVIDDVENSTSADALQIRGEMLSNSPYVSIDVLRTLAEENVLPQAMLLEVLLANPEATQDIGFIEYLQFEKPYPMPVYMITLIKSSWSGNGTPRSILERNIAKESEAMTALKDQIVIAYRSKEMVNSSGNTIVGDIDSILIWLNKYPSLRTKYEIIEFHLFAKDYQLAETILSSLPNEYKLSEYELQEYNAYNILYAFKKDLLQAGLEINQLDSARISNLKNIADEIDPTFSRSMARSVLCFFYKICYPLEERSLPQPTLNKNSNSSLGENPLAEVKVYPNPARDHVTFQLVNNGGSCTDCRFFVSDLQGRKVYEGSLDKLSGLHIWDTKNIAPGTYIYEIKTNTTVESGKIVVLK